MTDQERKQRLAAALRENLKRRKAQAREAASSDKGGAKNPKADKT
jgi:hypothetical protein